MPDERYDINFNATGVDSLVRNFERVATILDRIGAGAAGAGQFGLAGSALGGASAIGNFAQAAAPVAAMTAIVLAVTIALKSLLDALINTAKSIQAFAQLQANLGSSASQAGFLRGLGGIFGTDAGGAAGRLRAAIGSGLGAAAASRAGIPLGQLDLGTAVNQGQMLMQAVMYLREIARTEGPSAALAKARAFNIEDLYQSIYLTNDQIERMQRSAERGSHIFDEKHAAAAARLAGEMQLLHQQWEQFTASIANVFIPILTKVVAFFNQEMANPVGKQGIFGGAGFNMAKTQDQTQKEQTKALQDNTAELRAMNGFYGGGRRFRGAIPGAFGPGGGFALSDALRAQNLRLGAYSVSL